MKPMLYLLSMTCAHPCYFPTPQSPVNVAQKIDEDMHGGSKKVDRSARHMLPLVRRPCEEWSLKISYSSTIL